MKEFAKACVFSGVSVINVISFQLHFFKLQSSKITLKRIYNNIYYYISFLLSTYRFSLYISLLKTDDTDDGRVGRVNSIDGNRRMGRLWQSLILCRLHPIFQHLPVENMVYANQQAYYDAISESSRRGDSGPFIDFMLQEILNTLKSHQGEALDDGTNVVDNVGINIGNNIGENERKILSIIGSVQNIV